MAMKELADVDAKLSDFVYQQYRSEGLSQEEAKARMAADVKRMDRITEKVDAKHACAGCGADWHPPYVVFKWCGKCKAVKYCCRECQLQHRLEHRSVCSHNDHTQVCVMIFKQ